MDIGENKDQVISHTGTQDLFAPNAFLNDL